MKRREIFRINPHNYLERNLTQEENLSFFDICDGAWVHDGNPKKPHVKLTTPTESGEERHSNGYFNCPKVLEYPNLCKILAWQLVMKLAEINIISGGVDYVVGSSYAGITFSFAVADFLNAGHVFAQKDPEDPKGKKMIFKKDLEEDSSIIHIEELMTTAGTLDKVHKAVLKKNPDKGLVFLPVVGTIVHRPEKLPVTYYFDDTPVKTVSLIEKPVWAIRKSKCSLCDQGSEPLSAKSHWAKLTGKA